MAFTYFFRDSHTLQHICKFLVPMTVGRSSVNIWDAGCASGQEPFTLALMLAESMGRFSFRNLRIDATDIDGSNLFADIIEKGIYPREELERIPPDIFQKYFLPLNNGSHYQLEELIRSRLHFQKHDLLSLKPVGKDFSLILCKNVLLHFHAPQRAEVIQMFHDALAPGGLFATEQTQKMPAEVAHLFEQLTDDAQLYRKIETAS
ncbi:MAG: CheR family methyltransferase [Negativicutes bacterium]|nr:CheR family methyltransferase [Negativicutes bacterium]